MSGLKLQPIPYQTYGFTEGSNSPMTSALAFTQNMNAKQSQLNTVGGKRIKKIKYGGDNGSVTVPQFPQSGPTLSPINSNTSSIQTNTTSIATKNDAAGDYYAFLPTTSGGAKTGKHRHSKSCKHKRSKSKRSKHKRSNSKRSNSKRSNSKRSKSKRSNSKHKRLTKKN